MDGIKKLSGWNNLGTWGKRFTLASTGLFAAVMLSQPFVCLYMAQDHLPKPLAHKQLDGWIDRRDTNVYADAEKRALRRGIASFLTLRKNAIGGSPQNSSCLQAPGGGRKKAGRFPCKNEANEPLRCVSQLASCLKHSTRHRTELL